jgi:hypothetical protein
LGTSTLTDSAEIVAIHSWETDALVQMSGAWKLALDLVATVSSVTVVPLFGNNASRDLNATQFSATLNSRGVFLINGLAHGAPDAFTGWQGEFIYLTPLAAAQSQEVSGKLVHFFSCSSAELLGPALISAGCRGFIGYWGLLDLVDNPEWQTRLAQCDAQIDITLAQGGSIADGIAAAKRAFVSKGLSSYGARLQFCGTSDALTRQDILRPAGTPLVNVLPTNSLKPSILPATNQIASRSL